MIGVHVVQKGGRAFAVSCEDQNEVTIGRMMGNDIVLADVHVSSRHSRIVVRDGKYIIVDLKSRNGTYVNGKRISSPQVLKDGNAQTPPLASATELQPVLDALLAPDPSARAQTAREAIGLLERATLSLPPASRLDVERLVR